MLTCSAKKHILDELWGQNVFSQPEPEYLLGFINDEIKNMKKT